MTNKLYSKVIENAKFTIWLFIFLSIGGTIFSIDKSFEIRNLKSQIYDLQMVIQTLQNDKERINIEFKNSHRKDG